MSVFNADTQIPLAVKDPGTDWKLPPGGLLNYPSITEITALSGTNGHDTLHLTGDRDRTMNGTESTRISVDRNHTVTGNQQKQIHGNKNENILGNFIHQTTGALHRTIMGITNDFYHLVHTIQHKAEQKLDEPDSFYHNVTNTSNKGALYAQNYGRYDSYITHYNNVVVTNLDVKGFQGGVTAAAADHTFIDLLEKETEVKGTSLHVAMGAIQTTIRTVEQSTGGVKLHEVAFTQKMVVVGFNQFT